MEHRNLEHSVLTQLPKLHIVHDSLRYSHAAVIQDPALLPFIIPPSARISDWPMTSLRYGLSFEALAIAAKKPFKLFNEGVSHKTANII